MKLLSQDLVEKIVLDVIVDLSKQKGIPKEVASQSMEMVNDPIDNAIFSSVILTKIKPTLFSEEEEDTKVTVSQMLQLGYDYLSEIDDKSILELDLKIMSALKYRDIDALISNTKLNFALFQFVNAFHQYEKLENKYPELMKCM
jgi:hypothetical protein